MMKKYSNEQVITRIARVQRMTDGTSAIKAMDPRKVKRAVRILYHTTFSMPRIGFAEAHAAGKELRRTMRYGGSIAA